MSDSAPDQDSRNRLRDDAAMTARRLEERLRAIVRAVDGSQVGANEDELWFEPASASGLQVRLSPVDRGPCYDRSANFAISYGGLPAGEAPAAAFRDVVERIKAADTAPIADAAPAFGAAAAAVASPGATATTEPVAGDAASRWERDQTKELNVIFLDLCSRIFGRHGEALFPLHWGFWPTDTAPAEATAYDPQAAYSEALLAHVPANVTRILDVGCGLGFNAKLLADRGMRVTAVSPVAHHCRVIESAHLPGVDVRCARFETLAPDTPYDLLLFSESVNHFSLETNFLEHCKRFLVPSGFALMADDLTEERARMIETQRVFRVLRSIDITRNVAPTTQEWVKQMSGFTAYHRALMSVLRLCDPQLATRVQDVIDGLDDTELKRLFSGDATPPTPKGRYMIYLLQRN